MSCSAFVLACLSVVQQTAPPSRQELLVFTRALENGTAEDWKRAHQELLKFGPDAAPVAPELLALAARSETVRGRAIERIIHRMGKRALPDLLRALDDAVPRVRRVAVTALEK